MEYYVHGSNEHVYLLENKIMRHISALNMDHMTVYLKHLTVKKYLRRYRAVSMIAMTTAAITVMF